MVQEVRTTQRYNLEDHQRMEVPALTSFIRAKSTLGFFRNFQHSPRTRNFSNSKTTEATITFLRGSPQRVPFQANNTM